MKEIIGVVEKGMVKLPAAVHLPDGLKVKVVWDEQGETGVKPYDRAPLTQKDVDADLQWGVNRQR